MINHCLNCNHSFKGKFCPNCGQKVTESRLTGSVLIKDVIHSFTHVDGGFFYTTWCFLARPGSTAINYIAGKRKPYQTPFSYFLIWTGLFILIHNYVIKLLHYHLILELNVPQDLLSHSNIFFRQHFTFFIIPVIILSAVLLYFVMARPRYNFIEILISCLYGGGTYFMMLLLSDLILGLIFGVNVLSFNVFMWQTVLSSVYNFWFTFDFFKRVHIRFFWMRLILVSILVAILGFTIMTYLPMAWLYFFSN